VALGSRRELKVMDFVGCERVFWERRKRQGMTSQHAEELKRSHIKRQGTTSVVPKTGKIEAGL